MTIFDRLEIIRILIRGLESQWTETDWNVKYAWLSRAIKEIEILKSIAESEGVKQIEIPQLDMEGKPFK
jgi:hypothetical protein